MKSYDDFKEFYSEELFSKLVELDGVRKKILRNSLIATVVTLVLWATVHVLLKTGAIEKEKIAYYCWTGLVVAWPTSIGFFIRGYRSTFKQTIIKPLIQFINPNLQYAPEGSIDLYTFERAEIFERYINDFDGEDLVCGTIDKTKIKFSEVHARYREEDEHTDSKSGSNPISLIFKIIIWLNRTVFKGLFFVADFHKTFHGQVLVMPDKAEKYFGRFGRLMQAYNFTQAELITLENSEFEREFVVYGSDQIQARYVLSINIINKILDFKKKTGNSVYLSFKDSVLYIAVPFKRNLFEPPYFKSLLDYVATFQYFHDLMLFIGIVNEFNLNTRIWTKE